MYREVKQDQYVVQFNNYTMEFGPILEQGKHTTNVGVMFYPFLRTLRNFPLSTVNCISKDLVEIELEVQVQILMLKNSLIPVVLKQYGSSDNHDRLLRTKIFASIHKTCLRYTSNDYYLKRTAIDTAMFNNLQTEINEGDYGATIEFFQLLEVTLPDELVTVITKKQNIQQLIITAKNNQTNEIIKANTLLLQSYEAAEVRVIQANNTAAINYNAANVLESVIKTQWANRASAYENVIQSFIFDATDFLLYLKSELTRQVKNVVTN